ncbi:MAG: hypothetical protein HY868_20975 [Chloroflexi bacterium]|nr:hypothetical protein [Chloroflexota bacterium]
MITFKCAASCYGAPLTLCLVACPNQPHLGEPGEIECDDSASRLDDSGDELMRVVFLDASSKPGDPRDD